MEFREGAGLLSFRDKSTKLKAIEQETSIPYQELKLALQRRIK